MPKEVIQTELAPRPLGDYSQAWKVTGATIIFVAGQVSVDMDGNTIGVGDIDLQTRTALDNVKRILEGSRSSLNDVIKLNTYVTDMAEYREKTREIRREYFPHAFPASTLVEVKSLASPDYIVEIEAVAAKD
ncbi:RidA family protein [Chloroflexota bacterium]